MTNNQKRTLWPLAFVLLAAPATAQRDVTFTFGADTQYQQEEWDGQQNVIERMNCYEWGADPWGDDPTWPHRPRGVLLGSDLTDWYSFDQVDNLTDH